MAPRSGDSRTGSTHGADAVASIPDLKALRRQLREAEDPKAWGRELGRANRTAAQRVAGWARSTAASMGGPYRHFAGSISGRATQTAARIQIEPTANATFWGAKKRTGWNARNQRSRQQHPDWIGAGWGVGVTGQGPYAINDAIARRHTEIDAMYRRVIDEILAGAFGPATTGEGDQ